MDLVSVHREARPEIQHRLHACVRAARSAIRS